MKNCILGLCILGLTNLVPAQNDLAMVISNDNNVSSKTVKISNEKYLNSHINDVQNLAVSIKDLQKIAADYDVTKASIFSKNKSITYDVTFEVNENYIKAVYSNNGTILSSEEYYEDIRVPSNLSVQLAKEYPGWAFEESSCIISYNEDGNTTFTYNVKLKKGNRTKIITR